MKNSKTDPRARYTQSVIRKSLLKLLAVKSLKNVTVAEVCREAQVTRGTFYNHYYDVFDVYASIENDFFEEIKTRISGRKTYELDHSFFKEIMSFLSENSDVMTMLLADGEESAILKKIIRFMRDKYVAEFSDRFPALDRSLLEALYTYTVNGSIGLVLEWLRQGKRESTEQMAVLIEVFNKILISGYFKALAADS